MKNKKVSVIGVGTVGSAVAQTLVKVNGVPAPLLIIDDGKKEIPEITWDTPILEITQHPLFPEILKSIISISVRHERTGQSREFYQLFGWNDADKVIQEYYKVVLKQSQCSSRIRALIGRLIKVSCAQLIQKFDDGKRLAKT